MELSQSNIHEFVTCFKQYSTYDLSEYSENSLTRRIDKVLIDNSMNFKDLLDKLSKDVLFCELVMKQITVNTTELFRDTQLWQELHYKLLPLFETNQTIKIWHAGCSNGLEVYSLCILLQEMKMLDRCQIYASDLNPDILNQAIKGEYSIRHKNEFIESFDKAIKENPYDSDFKNISFDTYFEINKKRDIIQIKQPIRDKPIFKKNDLVKLDNIFLSKFDIILCRNVLIYFNNDLQKKVFEFFHKNLQNDGYLILGMQESMAWFMNTLFEKKGLCYKKISEKL